MTASLKILSICVSAALVCACIRGIHPQMASVLALAAGVAALMLSRTDIAAFSDALRKIERLDEGGSMALIKLCAVAMVAEFASDICRDAGEASLARRIDTGVRIGIAAAALPSAGEILSAVAGILQ